MMTRAMFATLFLSVMMALPAAAAENDAVSATSTPAAATGTAAGESGPSVEWSRPSVAISTPTRGAVLPALYVSFAALQAYDGYSTTVGLSHGARESNAVVTGLAGNPAVFWALKGSLSVVSIYAAERLWRQDHRGQAIAMMVVSNAVMAAVAARNASVLRAQIH